MSMEAKLKRPGATNLLIGATGKLGGLIARALLPKGVHLRLLVRPGSHPWSSRCNMIVAGGNDVGAGSYYSIDRSKSRTDLDVWLRCEGDCGKGYGRSQSPPRPETSGPLPHPRSQASGRFLPESMLPTYGLKRWNTLTMWFT